MGAIDGIILRANTKPPLVTKNVALNWTEIDNNFGLIYDAIVALNSTVGAGVLVLQGGYDPTITSLYPTNLDTSLLDAPHKGYVWYITKSGNVNGNSVSPGSVIFPKVTPGRPNVDADWVIVDSGFSMATLFTNWAKTLPGYDKTKKRTLTTVGDNTDTFEWSDFQQL